MTNDITKQTAYTADEVDAFLADVAVLLADDLPATKRDVALDTLAAVRAGISEYGLRARYVANQGVGRNAGARGRGGMKVTRTILDRNVAKLIERGRQNEADALRSSHEHEIRERSVRGTYDTFYDITCACGWTKDGFEYRSQADRAARDHATEQKGA